MHIQTNCLGKSLKTYQLLVGYKTHSLKILYFYFKVRYDDKITTFCAFTMDINDDTRRNEVQVI